MVKYILGKSNISSRWTRNFHFFTKNAWLKSFFVI
jgi:hypothetical protein